MTLKLDRHLINLGKDPRMSAQDAERQMATVDHLLSAFCSPSHQRREVQILADEVGMGKTFVALATAYTLLNVLRSRERAPELDDLASCYPCVVVLTPKGSASLARKWDREVEALQSRCGNDSTRTSWFRSSYCKSADALLVAIQRADDLRRRKAPTILIAETSVFTKSLSEAALRFLLACLFRWWGVAMPMKTRHRLAIGFSETGPWQAWRHWDGQGEHLWPWEDHEEYLLPDVTQRRNWSRWRHLEGLFSKVGVPYALVAKGLSALEATERGRLAALRAEWRRPPRRPTDRRSEAHRQWQEWHNRQRRTLRHLFKDLWPYLLERKLPLVIRDEAHHWRNNKSKDFEVIRDYIAPKAKRILMLTATPFQMDKQELLNILNVIDAMEDSIGRARVKELQLIRVQIDQRMAASMEAGQLFAKEWGYLADQIRKWRPDLAEMRSHADDAPDCRTEAMLEFWRALKANPPLPLEDVPGALRPFFMRALELERANDRLSSKMQELVIRHTRTTRHRRFWVGREFPPRRNGALRPDHDRIHLAPGQPLAARDELVQYLLMKVVAELTRGKHRTALGTTFTGCYSTMWQSKEGRQATEAAARSDSRELMIVLRKLTATNGKPRDKDHPKLLEVTREAIARWLRGEKTLIFCFRIQTAEAIYDTLSVEIRKRLELNRSRLLAMRAGAVAGRKQPDEAMRQFRHSLTARESSGIGLFLDRVLVGWLRRQGKPTPELTRRDVEEIAKLAARAKIGGRTLFPNLLRVDRVFMHRAMEHVWARRLATEEELRTSSDPLLSRLSDEAWVCNRYGVSGIRASDDESSEEGVERLTRSSLAARYVLIADDAPPSWQKLADDLWSRYTVRGASVLTSLIDGPNLFDGRCTTVQGDPNATDLANALSNALFAITEKVDDTIEDIEEDGEEALAERRWSARAQAVDATLRILLRDDVLLRMSLSDFEGHEDTWGERLLKGFHRPLSEDGQGESLAQRLRAFFEEVSRMEAKERSDFLRNAMNPRAHAVELVTGSRNSKNRDAIFCGFNTPLLPEILVCTSVGQEGIDLHRECRHVIHYDLDWNPAKIEQRTGRADRIGSKAERERRLRGVESREAMLPGLDIGLPYLAATYDERIFDALRQRAQKFQIVMGGDLTADRDTSKDSGHKESGHLPVDVTDFVPLPQELLDAVKVNLRVHHEVASSTAE